MTTRRSLCLSVVCILIGTGAVWSEPQGAVAVSPGGTRQLRRIAQSCPSFSWGGVEGAARYELVVYELTEDKEEGAEFRAPVIHTRLPGTALSWTPSVERCLEPGGYYVWYVRAEDALVEGGWSSGRYFEVAPSPSVGELAGALKVLRRYLAEHPEAAGGLDRLDEEALEGLRRDLGRDGEGARRPEAVPGGDSVIDVAQGRRGGARELRERLKTTRREQGFAALSSDTVGPIPSPQTVTTPSAFSLSIDGDFDLGGFVFKEGYPFLHNDGGSAANNTALGLNALVSATPGSPNVFSGTQNTAIGAAALRNNSTGRRNTASGSLALYFNTGGSENTASGFDALLNNTTGFGNTASGSDALRNNKTGFYNTASGTRTLRFNTNGYSNTASGAYALHYNTSGHNNTASGYRALYYNNSGAYNSAIGSRALEANTTGLRNTAVGPRAGYYATTGSDNIFLGSGAEGVAGEGNTIRIGGSTGTGAGQQNSTFIAGILGTIVTGDHVVFVDANGQLGKSSSSRRFKKGIEDMGDASSKLLALRPVIFKYKQEPVEGTQPLQFGLIAEEVADVFPDLADYDAEGRPETVRYHLLSSMLLNELQKQHRQLAEERHELERLRGRLARLEPLVAELAGTRTAGREPPRPSERSGSP